MNPGIYLVALKKWKQGPNQDNIAVIKTDGEAYAVYGYQGNNALEPVLDEVGGMGDGIDLVYRIIAKLPYGFKVHLRDIHSEHIPRGSKERS